MWFPVRRYDSREAVCLDEQPDLKRLVDSRNLPATADSLTTQFALAG